MAAQWGEIDGVPTLYAAAGDVQGPLHGALLFATGRRDETLKVAGINHVVEHLALHALGHPVDYAWNGQVDPVTTQFWAVGSPDQVVEFFGVVTRQLADLHVARLADELRVLEIESRRRGATHLGVDLRERFGPHGPGLLGWPEYGLSCLDGDAIVEWARTHFTAHNAVMWLSGPPPANLELRALPVGAPFAHAPLPPSLTTGSTLIAVQTSRVSLSLVSELGWGINSIVQIAQQRAMERLRQHALSYAVEFAALGVGSGRSLKFLEADGAEDALARVAVELVDVVVDLATSGPTDREIAGMREYRRQFRDHPDRMLSALDAATRLRLLDGEVITPQDADAVVETQTAESMCRELGAALPTSLMVGPDTVAAHLDGWSVGTSWSGAPVPGSVYEPIAGREEGTLVVGPEGVSWGPDDTRRIAVRWADVEACLTVDNGIRGIIGSTGSVIWVTPWDWRGGEDLTRVVDDAVDPQRRIRVGEGETSYLDPDGDAPIDVRWLGTIAGARWTPRPQDLVSLVIDADGLFLLHGSHGAGMRTHLDELRSADRGTLLAIDARNRWIAQYEIGAVELRRRPWTRVGPLSWALTIRMVDGTKATIFLTTDQQLDVARKQLPRLLGSRFRG
jgi:hypothetical protein